MAQCLALSVVLFLACGFAAHHSPSSTLAVSLYKAHLMSLAGWGGYWLDRWLFPYGRPHELLSQAEDRIIHGSPSSHSSAGLEVECIGSIFTSAEWAMMRRAVIVLGCLVCVALGA